MSDFVAILIAHMLQRTSHLSGEESSSSKEGEEDFHIAKHTQGSGGE